MSIRKFLSLQVDDQLLGLDIETIQDVLRRADATPVPLSGDRIAGLINLRGHVVTLIRVDTCLDIMRADMAEMNIVVEHHKELFGLLCDRVGDIQEIDTAFIEAVPPTLGTAWHQASEGVCRLPEGLMIILNPYALIEASAVTP